MDEEIRRVPREELERLKKSSRPGWALRKRDRPRCGILRKCTGKPCQVRVGWDGTKNAPLKCRCRHHCGLDSSRELGR